MEKQFPWLFCLEPEEKEQVVFCSASRPHRRLRERIPVFWKKRVWNYTHGWILLSRDSSRFVLLNPITHQTIHLPVLLSRPRRSINQGILWLPPEQPRSMVVLFDRGRQTLAYCYIHKKQWIELSYKTQVKKIVGERENGGLTLSRPITCNERLYALADSTYYLPVEIDIAEPTVLRVKSLGCEVIPWPVSHAPFRRCWLAESQGSLFAIDVASGGVDDLEVVDIGISKWDFNSSERQWRKVKGSEIQDRAFFLSDHNQLVSYTTSEQEFEGGCVYFVIEASKILHSFDVGDGSLTMSPQSFSPALWVMMPNLRRNKTEETRKKNKRRIKSSSNVLDSREECKWVINVCDLPHDVIELVAKKLTPIDYMNFRTTCKSCCQLAPTVKWRESSSVHEHSHSLFPWLMFSKSDHKVHHFIDPKSGSRFMIKADESLANAKIRHSKNGWVLMTDMYENSFFFYNPFTKEIIKLPEAPEGSTTLDSYCFTNVPTSSECVVMGVAFGVFCYFVMREQEWTLIYPQDHGEYPDDLAIQNTPVFFKGAFYFLGTEGNLSKFTLEDRDLIILNRLHCPCEDFCQNFLLEWDGKLVSVFIDSTLTVLQVFTLNEVKMVWEEVLSLGKYSLFLNRFSAFSIITGISEMENKVYFSKICAENNILFYCLKTKGYRCIRSEKKAKNLCDAKEYLSSCWIKPTWTV